MRTFLFHFALGLTLTASVGCKKDGDGPEGSEEHRDDDDDRDEQPPMPWPPPGAAPAPVPPQVKTLVESLVEAYNKKDGAAVQGFFINRAAFIHASECDPPTVVDDVMGGAKMWAENAKAHGGSFGFKGFPDGQGYLMHVKKGEKPFACKARMDVDLFLTKYDFEADGKVERGEAHFLRVGEIWYAVKL